MVEESISKKYSEQKMRCPVHLSIGQEIAPSILSLFSEEKDKCISTHRCHAHYLSKGGNLNKMIAEIYGKKTYANTRKRKSTSTQRVAKQGLHVEPPFKHLLKAYLKP